MTQLKPAHRRDAWALLLLVVIVSLLLWPYVYGGLAPLPDYLRYFPAWSDGGGADTVWNPLWYDAVGQYWPWRVLLHDGLRANTWPLWSPYQFSGYYLAGNGQSALFYPLNWLFFGLFDVPTAFRLTVLCHLSLAACGAYFLVRELGGSRAAALTAGVAFPLSGFLTCWLMLPTLISSGAWLTPALAFLERARRTGELRSGLLAGACLGLSALAGHPQIFYYVGLTALALGTVRLLPRRWPAWLACFAVAGLLAAPTLLPALDLARRGHRPTGASAEGYQVFEGRAIPWHRAVTLLLPRYFGSPDRGTIDPSAPQAALTQAAAGAYWGLDRQGAISPGDYTEFNVFVGVGVLLLALLGLRHGPAAARWYAGVGLLALLLAFGLLLNRWLYFGLPGWSAGAGPCRLALVWCCGAAVSAGLGLDALRRRQPPRVWPLLLALLLAGLAVGFGTSLWLRGQGLEPLVEVTGYRHLIACCWTVGMVALLLLAVRRQPRAVPFVVALELLLFGFGFNPACEPSLLDPSPPELRTVAAALPPGSRLLVRDAPNRWGFYRPPEELLLPPNLATAARLRDVGGYDSLMPAAVKQTMFAALDERQPSPAINGNMLLLGEVPPARLGIDVGGVLDLEPLPAPWHEMPTPGWFHRSEYAPARCVVGPIGGRSSPLAGAVRYDGWNRVSLTVPALPHLLLDSPAPGWRCYVGADGTAALAPAHWTRLSPFQPPYDRGRFVPLAATSAETPAIVRVQWVFAPLSVRLGIFLASVGLFALAAGTVAAGSKPRIETVSEEA